MAFVIKHSNSFRVRRLPAQPPRKSHNAPESWGVVVKTDPKHVPTDSTAESREPSTFWLPARQLQEVRATGTFLRAWSQHAILWPISCMGYPP